MTKYILVGGYVEKAQDQGKSFVDEAVKGFSGSVNILDCMFARSEETWKKKFEEDKLFFMKFAEGKKLDFVLAEKDNFVEQVNSADFIYLRGGDNDLLINTLKGAEGWDANLEGKTVAGSSAGAYALSKYYFMQKLEGMVGEGLGLVPVKTTVHYRAEDYLNNKIDWDVGDRVMAKHSPDLEVVNLREGEFRVFEQ